MNPKLRILLVDDDRRMTRTLADILDISGYEPIEAFSGTEALEKIQTLKFDCVLSDIKMPEMNGVELHRQLRQVQPGLPVVLMTAYSADDLIRKGLDEGVVGVLEKPLNITQILAFFSSLAKERSVVIVDNDPLFCQTLSDILNQRGFKVTQIVDPHVPVDQIIEDAQIILLDLILNSLSGYDILKEIRKNYPVLPVILITGYRQEMVDVIQAAMDMHAFTCLYKPLEFTELLQVLTQVHLKRLRDLLIVR